MKNLMIYSVITTAMLFMFCSHPHMPIDYPPDAPEGLYSVTGDGRVTLYWEHNYEDDLMEYALYSSEYEDGVYQLEGTTTNNRFVFHIPNGLTRYLAVAAVDYAGNESDLSYEIILDTPRPEGYNHTAFAYFNDEFETNYERCAIDFSDYDNYMIQSLGNNSSDVFIDNFEDVIFLNAWDTDTDIAMFGPTDDLSEVDYADPDHVDWDEEGFVPLYEDYSYIIWTHDNHFATIRIKEVYYDRIIFDWAYQTDEGNPELKKTIVKMPLKDRKLQFNGELTPELKAKKRAKINKKH